MSVVETAAGTGGGLRYVTEEPTDDMVNQESPYSCVVACVRQLLRDAGVEVSESELLPEIGVIVGAGSTPGPAAACLSGRHPRLRFVGGPLNDDLFATFIRRGPWIAYLLTDFGSVHSVIVDGCEDDVVSVRDPWGTSGPGSETGSRATLTLSDFRRYWNGAIFNGIAPNAVK